MSEVDARTVATLAEARIFLNIPAGETATDTLIVSILNGLNNRIENYIRTNMIAKEEIEYHDGNNKATVYLKKTPIVTVTKIEEDDEEIGSDEYTIDLPAGIIEKKEGIFKKGSQNIKVTYTGGYAANRATVPEALKLALKLWTYYVYKGVKDFSQRLTESSTVVLAGKQMPDDIRESLNEYRIQENTYSGV